MSDTASGSGTAVVPPATVLFVTGMSGAGRTSVANGLEDDGWYVADNVPVSLIGRLVETARAGEHGANRLALVVRASDERFGDEIAGVRRSLEDDGAHTSVVFVDASDSVLVRRYEQLRRRHPLQGGGTLGEAIAAERKILDPVRTSADLVIDTSSLSAARLRSMIEQAFPPVGGRRLTIAVQSFGFKYGLPIDCDLVADMRFLPNPYWIPELREHSGLEPPVRDYVLGQEDADPFLSRYVEIVGIVARGYLREGKSYMTLGIGCTGGKHRSVASSVELARRLRSLTDAEGNPEYDVTVIHRDLGRE